MREVLDKEFFERPALEVAPDLLGKFLVCDVGVKEIVLMITEVEAYDGLGDKASHASRGRTNRTEVMFGHPGVWYVYFIYGMYWMLNVITGPGGRPGGVLIRGTEVVSGPGRLTKHFGVNNAFNKKNISRDTGLWIENRGVVIKQSQIKRTARIGVDYSGPYWSKRKYRFLLKDK